MKVIEECEKIKVRLADGREFIVDFFPQDADALGITVLEGGVDSLNVPFVDVYVHFTNEGTKVTGG